MKRKDMNEDTLAIVEKNISLLKELHGPLNLADMKRLETLTNIRKVLMLTQVGVDVETHDEITDEEILEALSGEKEV